MDRTLVPDANKADGASGGVTEAQLEAASQGSTAGTPLSPTTAYAVPILQDENNLSTVIATVTVQVPTSWLGMGALDERVAWLTFYSLPHTLLVEYAYAERVMQTYAGTYFKLYQSTPGAPDPSVLAFTQLT